MPAGEFGGKLNCPTKLTYMKASTVWLIVPPCPSGSENVIAFGLDDRAGVTVVEEIPGKIACPGA
jgi:hypothetical protein